MAFSTKQRQQRAEKKKQKRKQSRQSSAHSLKPEIDGARYARYPIHECLIPSGLFETGIGSVIVARRTPLGDIAVGAFIVDVFCLGVKDALFSVMRERHYEQNIKSRLIEPMNGQYFETAHPSCVKKLIEGAIDYAGGFGFEPHADYRRTMGILNNVDASACPVRYVYGNEGKPFYIQGPKESAYQSKKIVEKLQRACGEDGCHYLVSVGGHVFDQATRQTV